jgi:hypothetical protein
MNFGNSMKKIFLLGTLTLFFVGFLFAENGRRICEVAGGGGGYTQSLVISQILCSTMSPLGEE